MERELELYLEALKRVYRWADDRLERRTADAVLVVSDSSFDALASAWAAGRASLRRFTNAWLT